MSDEATVTRVMNTRSDELSATGTRHVVGFWGLGLPMTGSGSFVLTTVAAGTQGARSIGALCHSTTDPACAVKRGSTTVASVTVNLAPCRSASELGCIESVATGTASQALVDAVFAGHIASPDPELPENQVLRIPRGSTNGLWSSKSGDHFLVRTLFSGEIHPARKGSAAPEWRPQEFAARVTRVNVVDLPAGTSPTEKQTSSTQLQTGPDGRLQVENRDGTCTSTQCFTETAMPDGTRIRIVLRLPRGLETWLNGRIDNAVVRTEFLDDRRMRVSMEGDAMPTYSVTGAAPLSSIPATLLEKHRVNTSGANLAILIPQSNTVPYFLDWEPYLGTRATVVRNRWQVSNSWDRFDSMQDPGFGVAQQCLASTEGLAGIVGTNAAVTDGAPPKWTAETGDLTFRIASAHLAPDGSDAVGRYSLALPRAMARCLYGRSTLPPRVQVTVTDSDGTTRTETSTISNDANWVRFSASGFGFSAPRIRVRLGVGTSVRVGASLSGAALRGAAGLPGSARAVVTVSPESAKVCRVRGGSVTGIKSGVCVVKVRSGAAVQTLAVLVRRAKTTSGQSLGAFRH